VLPHGQYGRQSILSVRQHTVRARALGDGGEAADSVTSPPMYAYSCTLASLTDKGKSGLKNCIQARMRIQNARIFGQKEKVKNE